MDFTTAQKKLDSIGQADLLRFWHDLSSEEQAKFLQQIDELDLEMYRIQKNYLFRPPNGIEKQDIQPLESYSDSGDPQDRLTGLAKLKEGHIGCIVVAGGQGTRLGVNGPKGAVPVSLVKGKSLFQLLSERVIAASEQAGKRLPLAVMTSPLNDNITRRFFKENRFFGLASDQIYFFCQGMLPFIGDQGQLLLQSPSELAVGPDGNGGALHHFYSQGIWEKWKDAGITDVCFIQIDNALADPFDAGLIGHHKRTKADITVKASWRNRPEDHVGVILKFNGQVRVIEYTELKRHEKLAVLEDGSLKHRCANLSMFVFTMSLIEKVIANHLDSFPVHYAHKPVKMFENGELQTVKAWKCERFIFDILAYANRVEVMVYPRHLCYAALKNVAGPDSLTEVQSALQAMDRRIFAEISGTTVPEDRLFELAPQFYYPTQDLVQRWKGRSLPSESYIDSRS